MKTPSSSRTGSKSRYASTPAIIRLARVSVDQKGIAVSPDEFVDVGKPVASLIVHTASDATASEAKASACAADMLIRQKTAAKRGVRNGVGTRKSAFGKIGAEAA